MESAKWPRVAEKDRVAGYATEQLIRQRPATELAALGSGVKVARLVTERRAGATRIQDGMIGTAMTAELVAAVATVLLFGGALVALVLGGATGGAAAAAVAGTISGLNAIRLCGYTFGTIVTTAPQARIYRRFVRSAPEREPQLVVPRVDSVALDNVTFRYPGVSEPALRDVCIEARRGELVALVGVNGAGKSTAVNLLLGSLAPDAGRVLIDGRDATELSESERLGHFGLLVQEFGRFEFTLRDAVALGSPEPYPMTRSGPRWRAPSRLTSRSARNWANSGAVPESAAGSGSGSHWRGFGCGTRACGSSTSPRRRSTRRPSGRSSPNSGAAATAGSRSSSRTAPGP
ncbi:ABC transporter ATP-binding protein/permease [Kribbella sp. NBC_00889]|nr:ABC transporter ATP-binding protein/permease [Kribbella sp. NBC_00889]